MDESGRQRTYEVRTFGCQMNVHDSERLAGAMEAAGYVKFEFAADAEQDPDLKRSASSAQPDVVVINTCAVRENADNKLYGNLGHLARVKENTQVYKLLWVAAWRKRSSASLEESSLGRRCFWYTQHGFSAELA